MSQKWPQNNLYINCAYDTIWVQSLCSFHKCCDCISPMLSLLHADHDFIVLANSKAWLVPVVICCLTITKQQALSSHCFYHALLFSVTAGNLENKIASNMFTAFFQDSYSWIINRRTQRSSEIEGEWHAIRENCSSSASVCVRFVDLQTCGAACWLFITTKTVIQQLSEFMCDV